MTRRTAPQQLSFFNSHYDTWRNLPVVAFVRYDDEPEQYLFAYLLRPGNAVLKRLADPLMEKAWR